jgi:hypothetical protein
MKIKELIEKLQNLNPEFNVFVLDGYDYRLVKDIDVGYHDGKIQYYGRRDWEDIWDIEQQDEEPPNAILL